MYKRFLLLMILILVVVACEQDPTEEPPAVPPSITLRPPFITQTVAFTATLTPSETFTPSNTPEATATETPVSPTPTFTPTTTPAIRGSILSASNVNVRDGAGNSFAPVATVAPNTEVGIVGTERNELNQVWYLIAFEDEEGNSVQGYVASTLIDDFGQVIPTLGPTSEFSPTPPEVAAETTSTLLATPSTDEEVTVPPTDDGTTAEPFVSATPEEGTFTPIPTGIAPIDVSDINVLAYCVQDGRVPIQPTEEQTVSIYWRWWVTRAELMQDHLDHVEYTVLLDGKRLEGYEDWQTDMVRDGSNLNRPTVWWYVPVGKLDPGVHTVEYKVTWDEQVFDGEKNFGPGTDTTEETGNCTFTVTEVGE
jgi:hypothetical protein